MDWTRVQDILSHSQCFLGRNARKAACPSESRHDQGLDVQSSVLQVVSDDFDQAQSAADLEDGKLGQSWHLITPHHKLDAKHIELRAKH